MSRTIFCLGARSHYENATSDLLAFFLDPQEEHGLGTLFIDALVDAAGLSGSYTSALTIRREERTESGKRIDMLIEGSSSIVTIENKHLAALGNPFSEYETHARKIAATPVPRTCEFVLLGFEDGTKQHGLPAVWRFVGYDALLNAIQRRLPQTAPNERWPVLTREFLNHMRMESRHFGPDQLRSMLRVVGAGSTASRRKLVDDDLARISLHVRPRLQQRVGDHEVRQYVWSNGDKGQGWPGGSALDFQVREHKSAHAIMSLAVRYSYDEPIDSAEQLLLVSWIRKGARDPGPLANFQRLSLERLGFRPIGGPSRDAYWSDGTAHVLYLPAGDLDVAMDTLARTYLDVTHGVSLR